MGCEQWEDGGLQPRFLSEDEIYSAGIKAGWETN